MHLDHHAIGDDHYQWLHEVFSPAEIVELGMTTSTLLGLHRWLHTLDLTHTSVPAIAFDSDYLRPVASPGVSPRP
jgi:hypothetical protein